jgi:hypothetical protein
MKRAFVILAILGAVAAWPAASGAATFKGTVVAKERGKLLVASPAGLVRAVSGRAALGARVIVNGGSAKVVGRAHTAHLRGVVIRRLGATMYISSNHHVVAVRNAKTRLLSSANDTTPAPTTPTTPTTPTAGAVVSTTVTVTDTGLDEDQTDVVGHQGSVQIQAQVVSVAAGTVTLLINGTQVPVNLPAGLTLPATLVGQTVTLTLNTDEQDGDNNQQGDDQQEGDNGDDGGSDG